MKKRTLVWAILLAVTLMSILTSSCQIKSEKEEKKSPPPEINESSRIPTTEFCGNGICDGAEDCSSCKKDCGGCV